MFEPPAGLARTLGVRGRILPSVRASSGQSVPVEQVESLGCEQGLSLTAEQALGLAAFAELFLGWNARINLGGRISPSELIGRHYLDAFAASRAIAQGQLVADVGSGGGLPAIPLALARPDLRIHLHEPTGKKVAFLRTAVRELGLKERVRVHAGRVSADDVLPDPPFDVAMSRATWAPTDWLALGRGMVHSGGSVLVFATGPGDARDAPVDQRRYASDRWLLVYRQRALGNRADVHPSST